jgi:hypothetical protein
MTEIIKKLIFALSITNAYRSPAHSRSPSKEASSGSALRYTSSERKISPTRGVIT